MSEYLPKAMMSLEAAREHATRVRDHLPSSHAEHALVALDDELRATSTPATASAAHKRYGLLRAAAAELMNALAADTAFWNDAGGDERTEQAVTALGRLL